MRNEARDLLLSPSPGLRVAGVNLLLAEGWSPAAILAEVPYLSPELVRAGDASRDLRQVAPPRAPDRRAN